MMNLAVHRCSFPESFLECAGNQPLESGALILSGGGAPARPIFTVPKPYAVPIGAQACGETSSILNEVELNELKPTAALLPSAE
jgi:hypothetical protein